MMEKMRSQTQLAEGSGTGTSIVGASMVGASMAGGGSSIMHDSGVKFYE